MPFYRNNNIGFAPHIIFAELFYFVDNNTYYDDKFLISTQGKLLLYSRDGNFIGQIGQRGRAANEYIGYTDCWIQDNHVYLYDMNGKKVLKYTLE